MNGENKPTLKTLSKRAIKKRKEQQFPLLASAKARVIRMSPTKVQRVLKQIQGCSYEEALILLKFLPYRACHQVTKVLKSAAANANNKYFVPLGYLEVEKAFVGQGPVYKRIRPRAKGRMCPIRKKTSHISIIVRSNFSRYEDATKGSFLPVKIT